MTFAKRFKVKTEPFSPRRDLHVIFALPARWDPALVSWLSQIGQDHDD